MAKMLMTRELSNEQPRRHETLVKELSILAIFGVIGMAARWNDILVKKLLMLAVFAVIGAAAAVGLAIAFPIWFAQFPGSR